MVGGNLGLNRKLVWVGWLVGCLLYLPRSRSTEKRESKGAYILLKPSENVQQACDIGLTSQEGLLYPRQTKQNKILKRSGYGAMRLVLCFP